MKACHRRELIQNASAIRAAASRISFTNRDYQLIPCRHAHPPHLCPRRAMPDGSKSGEATAQHPGTFLARQCVSHQDCRAISKHLIAKLESLGYDVQITPIAA
jgi:hypothetical protein